MNREAYSRTSRSKDEWETPPYFFGKLEMHLLLTMQSDFFHGFTLDPAASSSNHLCGKYYTKENDGLSYSWKGECAFVNPPYSNIAEWVEKCYMEGQRDRTLVVLLIPSRTDTRYWHDYCMRAERILLCKGRISFLLGGKKSVGGATFPSVVVVFVRHKNRHPKLYGFAHKE